MMIARLRKCRSILLVVTSLFMSVICQAQIEPSVISKIDSLMAMESKPVLILLSTDWCQYCRMQKNQIRKNEDFLEKADLFYYVEFDAESDETISFQGKDYAFKPTGKNTGTHELARALNGPGTLAFPTWVLLDRNYQVLFRHGGVLPPDQLGELLNAIGDISASDLQMP
ncbi:thioredoxin family protein [Sphingobacterium chuzhouense]|uniref:Thioredoxin family protein n=1 Tax=Sphingobacterium chuzhouense TaxID=1742264 RepID=A0ABR7XW63_9SPHI|nr:thioredoxin family protein [Sphingobacterium chuzhouense]MBD1423288.1 thioredoxin family protein [Sphingobacterium chuzhouense]